MAILFIAPDKEMADTARAVLRNFGERVEIVQALLGEALAVARRAEAQNVEVIVTRGGTALLLKAAGIRTPIVEIPVTAQDIADALKRACEIAGHPRPHVGMVAFKNMMLDLEALASLLDLKISFFVLYSEESACQVVDEAIQQGVEVLLGGVITHQVARQKGFPAVLIRSGESAFIHAFREARRVAYARRLEKERAEEFKTIIDYAYEGIAAINKDGRFTVFNPVAERLTGIKATKALGLKASELEGFDGLHNALVTGKADVNRLLKLGRRHVVMNCLPIRVDGEVTGAVATFQDAGAIQEVEAKIRYEIYNKGHVAEFTFNHIIGISPAIRHAIDVAREFAHVDSAVLITGETGVGKELFAQSIHNESARRGKPFVAVNCAALPENLLESELFGYVEGAFTGASQKGKPGLFELAHGGTVFLDEVSEIPLHLQGKLLRVLQERKVMRLGADRVVPVDVRVISATNKDLRTLVAKQLFRPDLYWRLNVLRLDIPPLRKRPGDIPILINHFLRMFGAEISVEAFSNEALAFLESYDWPGNVRELQNFCERVAVLCRGGVVDKGTVLRLLECTGSSQLAQGESPASSSPLDPSRVRQALEQASGNKTKAAAILGVHRSTLWRFLKKTGNPLKA